MKKLSYEDGHVVLRDMDGTLYWSSHWVDMKRSFIGDPCDAGYIEIFIEGVLIEKNDYYKDDKVITL
jgi:hypothetical protein